MREARPGLGFRARVARCVLLGIVVAGFGAGPVHGAGSATVSGRVVVNPIRVTLALSRTSVAVGTKVSAKATVWNDGSTGVRSVQVVVRVDRVGLTVAKPVSQTIRSIDPGASRSVTWSLCAAEAGVYLILAQATLGSVTIESQARILTVSPSRKGC